MKVAKEAGGIDKPVQGDLARYWAGDFDSEVARNLSDDQIVRARRYCARLSDRKHAEGRSGNPTMRYRVALLFAELGRSLAADMKPRSSSSSRAQRREPFSLDLSKGPQVFDAGGPVTLSEAAIKRLFQGLQPPDRGADAHSG